MISKQFERYGYYISCQIPLLMSVEFELKSVLLQVIYDLAFWQNQIKMGDDCAVRYSIRELRDAVVLSVHSI